MPTKQDLGTSKGLFSKFQVSTPGYAPYVNKVMLTWTISWVQKVKLHDLPYTSYATMYLHVILITKHERLCLTTFSKHWEESWKYRVMTCSGLFLILMNFKVFGKCGQTLSWVFDISSQSILILRGKCRHKMIQISAN